MAQKEKEEAAEDITPPAGPRLSRNKSLTLGLSLAHLLLWVFLAYSTIGWMLPLLKYGSTFGFYQSPDGGRRIVKIVDFPFHFNFVKMAWQRRTTVPLGSSIYSVENHLLVTFEWAHKKEIYGSLHFGYSPTMLWVLAPLLPFSHAMAYFLFNSAGLLAIFWMTRPSRSRWGLGLAPFYSSIAKGCFILGQTALVTGAGLLFVAEKSGEKSRATWRGAAIPGAALWALSAKPPIALTAAAVLVGLREWRTLIVAGGMTIVSTLAITPLLGPHWVRDYLRLLQSYDLVHASPLFSWAIRPEYMANLRAILNVDAGLPDNIASSASALVWFLTLAYTAIAGLRSRATGAALWAMGIFSYLLFCPHVTPTEELQVVVIFALCVTARGGFSLRQILLLVTLPLLPFLASQSSLAAGMRFPLFSIQLLLFLLFATERRGLRGDLSPGPLPKSA